MKLTFKDLKQQKFVIEAEPTETVEAVKEKIAKEKGWEASSQKLIYSGKILSNENTIESYNIEEKGFIVCMISKSKPAASSSRAAPATPAPAAASTPAPPAAPAPAATSAAEIPGTPSPAPAAAAASPSSNRRFDDPSSAFNVEERNNAIANMEAMGFDRAKIDEAMSAAFFNADRAVEYLISGIPEHLKRQNRPASGSARAPATAGAAASAPAAAPEQAPVPAATAPTESSGDEPVNLFEAAAAQSQGRAAPRGAVGVRSGGAGAGLEAGSGRSLDFLRNNPQFQQLRQLVQQQPQMLEPILQQVGAGNPQLAALITQRPDEFLQLLAEDNDDDAALPPGAQAISVTEEEREAIERLCRLGFERDLVIQAYFACDKNEELAANFLFDQPEEDDQ